MSKKKIFLGFVALLILGLVLSQFPPIKQRLSWRIEVAKTYLRGVINPVEAVPTAVGLSSSNSPSSSTVQV